VEFLRNSVHFKHFSCFFYFIQINIADTILIKGIQLFVNGVRIMAELMEQTAVETSIENRKASRTVLSWPVSIWLPEANRFFNGRTINVAKGGVLISMPMTTPIRPGHIVEINFPRTMNLAKKKGQFARIKAGKVLRVDREAISADATIGVAVEFA